jgi:peptide/nickel transport system permease protein
LVLLRNSLLDTVGVILCAAMLSIPTMVYVIVGQSIAAILKWGPVFGFKFQFGFVALPVLMIVVASLGADVRLYRAIFLEEISQDYVRTARAKGVSNFRLLFVHVLKNGAISLITLVVAALPLLILGSIVVEDFMGIPGLGNLMFDAIRVHDFAVIRASVWCGSLLYMLGLMLTDMLYAVADPRIRLK